MPRASNGRAYRRDGYTACCRRRRATGPCFRRTKRWPLWPYPGAPFPPPPPRRAASCRGSRRRINADRPGGGESRHPRVPPCIHDLRLVPGTSASGSKPASCVTLLNRRHLSRPYRHMVPCRRHVLCPARPVTRGSVGHSGTEAESPLASDGPPPPTPSGKAFSYSWKTIRPEKSATTRLAQATRSREALAGD